MALGAVAGVALFGAVVYLATSESSMLARVTEKINSIITPKAYPGSLSPARDIKGTWVSSLSGKGLELFGEFTAGGGVTKVYENGDVELIIEKVEGNTATGKMRVYNVCTTGQGTYPAPVGTISLPKQCYEDVGFYPVSIKVSASSLDFGMYENGSVSLNMQGNFTTDIMSGTITTNVDPYGVIKGEFHLNRKR